LLHYAAFKGKTRLIELLLCRWAQADVVADDGSTPLSDAINLSDFAVAEAGKLSVLKEKMAPWGTHWATLSGRTTLRWAAVIAALAGNEDALDYLCKE